MAVAFWRQQLALHLKHNMRSLCEHSFKDFHFPGLHYVCLGYTPTLTTRLYILDPAQQPLDTTAVNIHTHLYDSQLLCLHGSIRNTTYALAPPKRRDCGLFYPYQLTSALHPANEERAIVKTLRPGATHFQPHDEIHNVANDPAAYTAFMAFEFPTVKTHSTLFTRESGLTTLPTPGCYTRYTPAEMTALLNGLLRRMSSRSRSPGAPRGAA